MLTNAIIQAKKVLHECGIGDPTELPLKTIIQSRGAFYEEKELKNSDGRIVFYDESAIITVNSLIPFESRKRFAAAHELGHFELHKKTSPIISDTEYDFVNWFKAGQQEREANEFAAEFLMPSQAFSRECLKKKFDPSVISFLSERFQTSRTSTILRFVEKGNHPVCVICCVDNKMAWWKASHDFRFFLNFSYNSPPPSDSVAYEMFTSKKYFEEESKQQIWKSTWLSLGKFDSDKPFFEYCLFVPTYKYSLSLIWED